MMKTSQQPESTGEISYEKMLTDVHNDVVVNQAANRRIPAHRCYYESTGRQQRRLRRS